MFSYIYGTNRHGTPTNQTQNTERAKVLNTLFPRREVRTVAILLPTPTKTSFFDSILSPTETCTVRVCDHESRATITSTLQVVGTGHV